MIGLLRPIDLRVDLESIAAALWPGPCPLCGAWLGPGAVAGVCARCWLGLPRETAEAGPAFPIVAPFRYEGDVVTLHRRLKFDGQVGLAGPFGAAMAAAWRRRSRPDVDAVVAVPADPLRWGMRRSVPRRLARRVARRLDIPAIRALAKLRPTRPQSARGRTERLRALTGAFAARAESVAGLTLLLVDDVATTGATLFECGRALARSGGRVGGAVVLARTPRGGRPRALRGRAGRPQG